MNDFTADFSRLMRMKMNPDSYPRIQYEYNLADRDYESSPNLRIVDRVQVQFAEHRWAFLLRHPIRMHWCGYALIPFEDWFLWQKELIRYSPVVINYSMPSVEPICWMIPNSSGQLKRPSDITRDGDFFIGFDMASDTVTRGDSLDSDAAFNLLSAFENVVYRVRHGQL